MAGRDLTQQASEQVVLLRRDDSAARCGGVCAAVSAQTGIDLRLVRILTVVLALSGGLGIGLYACAWALLPSTSNDVIPLARVVPAARQWDARTRLRITLLVAVVIWLVCSTVLPFGPIPVILALIVLLVHRQKAHANRGRAAVSQTPTRDQFDLALSAWQTRVQELQVAGTAGTIPDAGAAATVNPPGATALPRPSRLTTAARRSLLAGAAGTLLAAGFGQLVFSLGDHLVPTRRLELSLAAALAVVGATLVALGMARVRPALLTLVGMVLCVWIGGLQLGLVNAHGTWSTQHHGTGVAGDPMTLIGVSRTVTLPATAPSPVHVRARASQVILQVPADTSATVVFRLRGADVQVARAHAAGSREGTLHLSGSGSRTVTIQLDAVASRVEVRHA